MSPDMRRLNQVCFLSDKLACLLTGTMFSGIITNFHQKYRVVLIFQCNGSVTLNG